VIVGAVVVAVVVAAIILWPREGSVEPQVAADALAATAVPVSPLPTTAPTSPTNQFAYREKLHPLVEELETINQEFAALVSSSRSRLGDPGFLAEIQDFGVQFLGIGRQIAALRAPTGWEDVEAGYGTIIGHLSAMASSIYAGMSFMITGDEASAGVAFAFALTEQDAATAELLRVARLISEKSP